MPTIDYEASLEAQGKVPPIGTNPPEHAPKVTEDEEASLEAQGDVPQDKVPYPKES